MNINELLRGVQCECGRIHTCNIKHVFIEDGAISRLSDMLSEYRGILLVADGNTYGAAGEKTEKTLVGKRVERCIFPAQELLIPDERAIAAVMEKVEGIDAIVGIGSGVIQDLCKYISRETKIPYYVVATAPSMDGYASSGAAMITGGMKVTYPATLPTGIVADVDVLKNAPLEMIKAGWGDIVGKYSALSDWCLANAALGEYLCPYVYNLTYDMLKATVPLAGKLLERDGESVKTLMEALIGVGIAMSFATNSRPASGSEHHLSHFFEITGIVEGKPYLAHGIDVLYSSVITARIRERLLSLDSFERISAEPECERISEIKRVYSTVSDGCIALQDKLGTYKTDRIGAYVKNREAIRLALATCPSSAELEALVGEIGLDMNELYSTYGKDKIKDAVLYAKELKDRYTVLWMYYDIFGAKEIKEA